MAGHAMYGSAAEKNLVRKKTLLADCHLANPSIQGSALERTDFEALPQHSFKKSSYETMATMAVQAEPARHWVTRQSPVTRGWRSARSARKNTFLAEPDYEHS
jgi:hypothetical protein